MSVLIETTLGDLVFDLYTEQRPKSCLNFLKLCKIKYYNFCCFHSVRRNFIAQSGDPTGTGRGGVSVYAQAYGDQAKYFELELKPRIKHNTKGTISFVNNGNDMHGSQFFITLGDGLDFLDGKHTVFGQLAEGFETLEKLNETICDESHKPFQDVRISHTIILEDPFDDPKGLVVPNQSPEPNKEMLDSGAIAADEEIEEDKSKEEIQKKIEDKELAIGEKILETLGDIDDADLKPPENVLFVCKLNPVTNADDLKVIFSRFGKIDSCEIIKDFKTGDSLCYGFIEFKEVEACEKAYFKMDNVLIDDRRIHIDFCQSINKIKKWHKSDAYSKKEKSFGYAMKESKKDKYSMVFDDDEDSSKEVKKKTKKTQEKKLRKDPKRDDSVDRSGKNRKENRDARSNKDRAESKDRARRKSKDVKKRDDGDSESDRSTERKAKLRRMSESDRRKSREVKKKTGKHSESDASDKRRSSKPRGKFFSSGSESEPEVKKKDTKKKYRDDSPKPWPRRKPAVAKAKKKRYDDSDDSSKDVRKKNKSIGDSDTEDYAKPSKPTSSSSSSAKKKVKKISAKMSSSEDDSSADEDEKPKKKSTTTKKRSKNTTSSDETSSDDPRKSSSKKKKRYSSSEEEKERKSTKSRRRRSYSSDSSN